MDFGECGAWQGGWGSRHLNEHLRHIPWPPSPVYKTSLSALETSDSNPYIYYNNKAQAIIKSGMSGGRGDGVGAYTGVPTWGRPGHASEHTLALISSGTDSARPLTVKKFVTHHLPRLPGAAGT